MKLRLTFFVCLLLLSGVSPSFSVDRSWLNLGRKLYNSVQELDSSVNYSEKVKAVDFSGKNYSGLYAEVEYKVPDTLIGECLLVLEITNKSGAVFYKTLHLENIPFRKGEWQKASVYVNELQRDYGDIAAVKSYVKNSSRYSFFIRNLFVKAQEGDTYYLFENVTPDIRFYGWIFLLAFVVFILFFTGFKQKIYRLLFVFFTAILLFFTILTHKNSSPFDWEGELFADQAGYYVYLPSVFIYDFDGSRFPEQVDVQLGEGFKLDSTNKVHTKYTYGVAFMQAPFFLAAHALTYFDGAPRDGFTGYYRFVPDVAALFYICLSALLLFSLVSSIYDKRSTALALFCLFTGTNIFYYFMVAPGMSHAYSLALFSLFLYLFNKINKQDKQGVQALFLLFFTASFILLLRPINIIFIVAALFYFKRDKKQLLGFVLDGRNMILVIVSLTLVWLPQLFYWKYISGHWLHYSYQGEGFTYLLAPRLLGMWFSPHNGMFVYTPLYLLVIASVFYLFYTDKRESIIFLSCFLVLCYFCASWHSYNFGCAFGSRNFVEYNAFFLLPFTALIQKVARLKIAMKTGVYISIVACIFINQKLSAGYRGCYKGTGTWDYSEYVYLFKIRQHSISYELNEHLNADRPVSREYMLPQHKLGNYRLRRARVKVNYSTGRELKNASLICHIQRADTSLIWTGIPLNMGTQKSDGTRQAFMDTMFDLPVNLEGITYHIFILNEGREQFLLKNMQIVLE